MLTPGADARHPAFSRPPHAFRSISRDVRAGNPCEGVAAVAGVRRRRPLCHVRGDRERCPRAFSQHGARLSIHDRRPHQELWRCIARRCGTVPCSSRHHCRPVSPVRGASGHQAQLPGYRSHQLRAHRPRASPAGAERRAARTPGAARRALRAADGPARPQYLYGAGLYRTPAAALAHQAGHGPGSTRHDPARAGQRARFRFAERLGHPHRTIFGSQPERFGPAPAGIPQRHADRHGGGAAPGLYRFGRHRFRRGAPGGRGTRRISDPGRAPDPDRADHGDARARRDAATRPAVRQPGQHRAPQPGATVGRRQRVRDQPADRIQPTHLARRLQHPEIGAVHALRSVLPVAGRVRRGHQHRPALRTVPDPGLVAPQRPAHGRGNDARAAREPGQAAGQPRKAAPAGGARRADQRKASASASRARSTTTWRKTCWR
ncbi:hypothetical protein ABIB38_003196 [Massilia sp. UYP11]